MTLRPVLALSICTFLISVSAMAQVPQPASDTEQAVPNTDASQGSGDSQAGKTENPPEPEAHGTRLRWQDIPRNVLHDQRAIFTSPFHINRENARWWALFGGGTIALITMDQRISDKAPQKTFLTRPSHWASKLGADYFLFPAWASFYLFGKVGDNPRARDTGRIGIEGLIDAEITVNVLKVITQRPRPEIKGDRIGFFKGGDSFPSGHSIKSWALARILAREYPDPKIIPVLAYATATAVSVARVGGRRHSASDALAGAAMGFFIGDYVYRNHHAPSKTSTALLWFATHANFEFGNSHLLSPRPTRFIGPPSLER
jgi:membrane-associated phospholipid phosphatase